MGKKLLNKSKNNRKSQLLNKRTRLLRLLKAIDGYRISGNGLTEVMESGYNDFLKALQETEKALDIEFDI